MACSKKDVEKQVINDRKSIIIEAKNYGVKGDAKTDNAKALLSMNKSLRKYAKGEVEIIFENGTFLYSNNTWLQGLENIKLEGKENTKLKNINTQSKYGIDTRPLYIPFPFDPPDYKTNNICFNGDPFNMAKGQSNYITITDSRRLTDYTVGDRILLYGFEQQFWGFPHNPRYFEYKKITKIDKGRIYFDSEITHDYDSRWKDELISNNKLKSGQPRILNLDKGIHTFPKYVRIRNIEFLESTSKISDLLIVPGNHVILDNVTLPKISPSVNEKFEFINSNCLGYFELDKLLDKAWIKNSTLSNKFYAKNKSCLTAATGVNYLNVSNSTLHGRVSVSPRILHINNCTITPNKDEKGRSIGNYVDSFPIESVTLKNITVNNEESNLNNLIHFHGFKCFTDYQINLQNKTIRIKDSKKNRNDVIKNVARGTTIYDDKGNEAKVEAIFNNQGYWNIKLEGTSPFSKTKSICWSNCNKLVVDNIQMKKKSNKEIPLSKISSKFRKKENNFLIKRIESQVIVRK